MRRQAAQGLHAQQRTADGADEGVHAVPKGIEPRHLVREEFQDEHDRRHAEHPRVAKHGHVVVLVREVQQIKMDQQAGDQHCEVEVDPGNGGQAKGETELFEDLHGCL